MCWTDAAYQNKILDLTNSEMMVPYKNKKLQAVLIFWSSLAKFLVCRVKTRFILDKLRDFRNAMNINLFKNL